MKAEIYPRKALYIGENIADYRKLALALSARWQLTYLHLSASFDATPDPDTELIFYDLFQPGCDFVTLIGSWKAMLPQNCLHLGIASRKINRSYLEFLSEQGLDDVLCYPIQPDFLLTRLQFLSASADAKPLPKINFENKLRMPLAKRALDIAVSFTALLCLSPLLLLIALVIRLESPGRIFYISKRVGTGYRIFDFYKFRTMRMDAEKLLGEMQDLNQYTTHPIEEHCPDCAKLGAPCSTMLLIDHSEICEAHHLRLQQHQASFVKFKSDPRITRFGKFLRNSSIDELPQLFNILKGDMSLVGNRPLPLYEAEMLTTDDWAGRFMAPAGLTGLWQVRKRGTSDMNEAERKRLDNNYAVKRSFLGDLRLLLKTLLVFRQKESV